MKASFLLRGGHVIDPAQGLAGRVDLRARAGKIVALGQLAPEPGERVIDITGLNVAPGLVDVHVHLREPGQEWKETIASGTAAAAAGGFTTIFCMPNTEPALDSVAALAELDRRIEREALVKVRPIATISEGRAGRRASDYEALARAGAVGYSDDGESTADAGIMWQALTASKKLNRPVMVHCEEPSLTGGAMHLGDISRKLGVPAIPAAAEEIIIGRDLALAAATGGWLHICHVSTARGAEAIAGARERGVWVTAEVMPHHLVMTDAWVGGCRRMENADASASGSGNVGDPNTKVNPPLRSAADAKSLLRHLCAGDLEVVATDHAPHGRPEKEGRTLQRAAFGLIGSELALPIMLALVKSGGLTLSHVISLMSTMPARLWGLNAGTLAPGASADIVVFDTEERWLVNEERLVSRSANTPLLGMELQGRVRKTFVDGEERYRDC
jgi:dihydroorotase